jgi:hypothetical protein
VQAPLTLDRATVHSCWTSADRPAGQQTAIGDAIDCHGRLRARRPATALVLLTDGASNAGSVSP